MVTLHRSWVTQQTCRNTRAPLPGHLPSSGARSIQRRETRTVAMHNATSTQHRGENNTKKARVRYLPASQSTIAQPPRSRTITQMCATVTVAHRAPSALPSPTRDSAIQRPVQLAYSSQFRTALHEARSPLRLPSFKQQDVYTQLAAAVTRQRQLPVDLASDNLSKRPGKSPRYLSVTRSATHVETATFSNCPVWHLRHGACFSGKSTCIQTSMPQLFGNTAASKCCSLVAHEAQHHQSHQGPQSSSVVGIAFPRTVRSSHLPQCRMPKTKPQRKPVSHFVPRRRATSI
ncbi:hypothetical protein TRVL_04371 [Trypanosoma vivax]|nr:hypothetical protein TRVL_04371 [Trypanosoma vivax]